METTIPEHLSEKSKHLFIEYVPRVFRHAAQVSLFVLYLENLDLHAELVEAIRTEGMMITNASGNRRANPLIREKRKADAQLIRIASQLGISHDLYFDQMTQEFSL